MSGLLGDIFSAGDRMKRKLRGLLDDPMGTIALGSQRMSEDVQQMGLLADESGYMPGTNSVLLTPQQKARARKQLADKGAEMGAAMIGTTKFTYPQEKALATAQRNAAKPVSEGGLGLHPQNTPAERAAAMGHDVDLLHGTTNDFPAFSESSRHSTYATQDPKIADIYANATGRHKAFRVINAGPNVIPLVGRGRLLETSDYRNGSGGWLQNNMADALGVEPRRGLTKDLQSYGFDGAKVTMDDLGGAQTQFMYPDPKVLRSRFAAFDPMRKDSPDLLAGMLPFGLLYEDDKAKKRKEGKP